MHQFWLNTLHSTTAFEAQGVQKQQVYDLYLYELLIGHVTTEPVSFSRGLWLSLGTQTAFSASVMMCYQWPKLKVKPFKSEVNSKNIIIGFYFEI